MSRKGDVFVIVGVICFLLALGIIAFKAVEARFGEKTGEIIQEGEEKAGEIISGGEEESKQCGDSDGGRNYFAAGTVTMSGTGDEYSDVCYLGNLTEHYCDIDMPRYAEYVCPLGCDGNACNSTVYTIKDCTDDDGGKNYFTYGNATNTSGTYGDKCLEIQGLSVLLEEYFCLNDTINEVIKVDRTVYRCDKTCENGACRVD